MKLRFLLLTIFLYFCAFSLSEAQIVINKQIKKKEIDSTSYEIKSRIGTFIGTVSKLDAELTNSWSFGFNYNYRLDIISKSLEIGIFADYVADSYGEFLIGLPISYNLGNNLRANVAPGIAFLKTPVPTPEPIPTIENAKYETTYMTRVGFNYSFYLDELFISPKIHADLVNARTFVGIGVNFGFIFY